MRARTILALLALAAAPAAASGQGLAERIRSLEDGTARITYPTRPGVEICENGIMWGEKRMMWHSRGGWRDEPRNCRMGSAEVEIMVRAGRVRDVEILREEWDRRSTATELGHFPAREVVDFFLAQAREGGRSGRGVEEAIFPAVIADVDEIWRQLLALAQDRGVDTDAREQALFWVGQEAADAVTEGLAEVALDEDEDQDVRDAAVFALSQRHPDEGVPILMEVARTARDGETRRTAMFWLAQSKDERVYAFFEEILLGRGGA